MSEKNDCDKEYSHHEEGGWDVWTKSGEHSLLPQISKPSLSNVDCYKVANFLIKQLHSARLEEKYFIFSDSPFLYVYLTGTIVSKTNHKEKLCLEVNDGTGSITCLLEDEMLNQIEKEKKEYSNISTIYTKGNEENSIILQASLMNIRATQYIFKHVPYKEDLHLGNIVALTGKLTEYNGKKYIFVSKINTASVEDHIDNLYCLRKHSKV